MQGVVRLAEAAQPADGADRARARFEDEVIRFLQTALPAAVRLTPQYTEVQGTRVRAVLPAVAMQYRGMIQRKATDVGREWRPPFVRYGPRRAPGDE